MNATAKVEKTNNKRFDILDYIFLRINRIPNCKKKTRNKQYKEWYNVNRTNLYRR